MFKEKITRALDYLGIGYIAQNRANESSQYLKLKLPNGNSIDVRASDHPQKYRADISVERNWKSAIRFIVDQNKEDTWGSASQIEIVHKYAITLSEYLSWVNRKVSVV